MKSEHVPQGPRRGASAWVVRRGSPNPSALAEILDTLPEWFGRVDANEQYLADAQVKETWTARAPGNEPTGVVGVALVNHPFAQVTEIHLMAVRRDLRGQGVGTALLSGIENDARHRQVRMLLVKTLGPSHPDPNYAQTRAFYQTAGFLPLEENDLWGPNNPCLFMVKQLSPTSRQDGDIGEESFQ